MERTLYMAIDIAAILMLAYLVMVIAVTII